MRFWLIGLLLLPIQQSPQPYYDFAKAGAGFYGAGREAPDPDDLDAVRIGVLGPEKDPEGSELRTAVQLALEEANRQGGYRRRVPYEMAFRADDGFWGVVASRVVDLAYEDKVWTIIGGLDGQRTHIAELIVAKAWVPVVSPWTSDTSVDYANVPWVFRCAPADSSQVDALVAYAKARGFKSLVALTEIEREAYTGYRRLDERLEREKASSRRSPAVPSYRSDSGRSQGRGVCSRCDPGLGLCAHSGSANRGDCALPESGCRCWLHHPWRLESSFPGLHRSEKLSWLRLLT